MKTRFKANMVFLIDFRFISDGGMIRNLSDIELQDFK